MLAGCIDMTTLRVAEHVKTAVLRLAEDGVIAGLKDSSGDDAGLRSALLDKRDLGLDAFSVFTGSELVVDSMLAIGADGAVPGLANIDPAGYVALYDYARYGDIRAARREQERLMRLHTIVDMAGLL